MHHEFIFCDLDIWGMIYEIFFAYKKAPLSNENLSEAEKNYTHGVPWDVNTNRLLSITLHRLGLLYF
jgi:hypothetical protein